MKSKNSLPCKMEQMETQELFSELSDTRFALSQAYVRFNNTAEPELIEAAIYEINAIEARYSFLLRRLKQQRATAAFSPTFKERCTWL